MPSRAYRQSFVMAHLRQLAFPLSSLGFGAVFQRCGVPATWISERTQNSKTIYFVLT